MAELIVVVLDLVTAVLNSMSYKVQKVRGLELIHKKPNLTIFNQSDRCFQNDTAFGNAICIS